MILLEFFLNSSLLLLEFYKFLVMVIFLWGWNRENGEGDDYFDERDVDDWWRLKNIVWWMMVNTIQRERNRFFCYEVCYRFFFLLSFFSPFSFSVIDFSSCLSANCSLLDWIDFVCDSVYLFLQCECFIRCDASAVRMRL